MKNRFRLWNFFLRNNKKIFIKRGEKISFQEQIWYGRQKRKLDRKREEPQNTFEIYEHPESPSCFPPGDLT